MLESKIDQQFIQVQKVTKGRRTCSYSSCVPRFVILSFIGNSSLRVSPHDYRLRIAFISWNSKPFNLYYHVFWIAMKFWHPLWYLGKQSKTVLVLPSEAGTTCPRYAYRLESKISAVITFKELIIICNIALITYIVV